MNLYEKLKRNKGFIYSDNEGLVAIWGNNVKRITESSHRCNDYKKKIDQSTNSKEIKYYLNKLRIFAEAEIDQDSFSLQHYLESLSDSEKDQLLNQVEKLEAVSTAL